MIGRLEGMPYFFQFGGGFKLEGPRTLLCILFFPFLEKVFGEMRTTKAFGWCDMASSDYPRLTCLGFISEESQM